MLTVKAFEKGLVCRGFTYEVGKEYSIPTEEVEICEKGFHASANCDISETIDYYPDLGNTEYALVDLNVVKTIGNKAVGDKIKIIKKLETLDELIKYDKTGKWCAYYAEYLCNIGSEDNLIKNLQDAVIEKDTTGKWCCLFAECVKGADIERLEDAVIEKDVSGEWCFLFAKYVENANIRRLQDIVIQKDTTGEWCYRFAKDVEGADIERLEDAVIEKDVSGEWCEYFASYVEPADISELEDAVIQKDITGNWCLRFAIDVCNADVKKLQQVSKQKERTVIQKLRNLEEENKQLKKIMRDILDSEAYVEYVDECRRWGYKCSFCGAFVRDNQPLSEMKHKQDCVIAKMIKVLKRNTL